MPSQTISKYKNRRSGGFDSKREEKRGWELELLSKANKIFDLRRQVKFELIPKQDGERAVSYIADFAYFDMFEGGQIVEDVKSPMTRKLPAYIIKRKLMLWIHKIRVREV